MNLSRVAAAILLGSLLAPGVGCKTQRDAARLGAVHAEPSATAAPVGHVRLVEAPASGDVEPIVRNELAKAASEKRRLIVYVGASWCEPCRNFHAAAAHGELDTTFPNLTLLTFDLDRDSERLALAGYVSRYIPLFAVPAADGTSSGKQVEGGVKGMGAVAYIAPRLQSLLEATVPAARP